MSLPAKLIEINGLANTVYDDSEMYEIGFTAHRIIALWLSGGQPVYLSFNGKDDHIYLGTSPSQLVDFNGSFNRVWVRSAVAAGNEVVKIMCFPEAG